VTSDESSPIRREKKRNGGISRAREGELSFSGTEEREMLPFTTGSRCGQRENMGSHTRAGLLPMGEEREVQRGVEGELNKSRVGAGRRESEPGDINRRSRGKRAGGRNLKKD